MQQIKRQLNLRFEERLSERMRIAQDLHDTLLQGVLSASMQLHIANERISEESTAKPLLRRVIELMGQVAQESRKTLKGLRSSVSSDHTLEQALASIREECAVYSETAYRVTIEGEPRPLQPVVRDEVYRIGREAIVNAFRHAHATSIEVRMEYSSSHLQMVVRDNGRGIDERVLDLGKEGHWGLPGMREHAEEIGAKLRVLTGPAAGTEVDLVVPAGLAYEAGSGWNALWRLLGKSNRKPIRKTDGDDNR
jgi:signal transduction histidine kinase